MLRQSILILFAFFALSANASVEPKETPMDDFISSQIEELELELELFGTPTNNEIINVSSIAIYEIEEDITINFDANAYLPKDFDARKGMNDIDWNAINLYEVEEEVELGFNVKSYLPKNFNPYQGMITVKSEGICLF